MKRFLLNARYMAAWGAEVRETCLRFSRRLCLGDLCSADILT
jgi:hypothetical protein